VTLLPGDLSSNRLKALTDSVLFCRQRFLAPNMVLVCGCVEQPSVVLWGQVDSFLADAEPPAQKKAAGLAQCLFLTEIAANSTDALAC
jgi:hypothetical protein